MKMFTRLLLSFLLFNAVLLPQKLFAHTVDYFNCCGYTCAGSTMSVNAHVSNTNSSSKYNWQFRDYSKTWKCFVNGSNTINGVAYSVSGVYATGTLSTSPTLNIANAQGSLNNVEIRLLIADGGSPCTANPSFTVWGGDKALRLHVLAGSDCSAISTFCSMGCCIGNTLNCSTGYYGGFEVGSGGLGPAATDYTYVSSNSSCGQYSIVNSASKIYNFFPAFAPHSGNYMMYVDGSNTASKRFWYNSVSVVKGNMYEFSAWIANANNTSNQKAAVRLKITGANSAEVVQTVTSTAGDWQYVKLSYVASATCTVTLSMSDDNCSCTDNDFVVDDICFKCDGPAPKLNLGNLVWNDYDGDGKRDANENAIGGITVSLYTDNNADNKPDGAAIKTTLTDIKGAYLFTDLTPGRYITSIPVLLGYSPSPNNVTTTNGDPNNNVDNDNNAVNLVSGVDYTNAITLTVNEEPTTDGDGANGNLTMDMALCGNAFIGDFVWNDVNANGIQDAGEPGINGQLVTITFADGTTASTLTHFYGFDGYYNFPNLGGGTYKITFSTPAGLLPTPSNVGSNDEKDSDPVNGSTTVVLTPNVSNFTIDAGFTAHLPPVKLSLGNLVWNDLNNNGVRDSGEPGLSGYTVMLFKDANGDNNVDSAAIATTTTLADGTYVFNNLEAGKYIIATMLQGSFMQGTVGDSTPDDNIDNDNNGIGTYQTYVYTRYITLSAGDEPTNDGSDNNSNFTFDIGLTCHTSCHNDCTHNCTHPNCGHNSCHNDCTHNCTHPNCGHNSCHNDCTHNCTHPNCGHNSCHNDCTHNCTHPNCGHNSCHNDCTHNCTHPNCGHNSCHNDCTHNCTHPNCGHNSCHNDCTHNCTHPNCGHNSCHNDCTHNCTHLNCGHNSCHNDCNHVCNHPNCGHNSCHNDCNHVCSHPNCAHNSCKNNCLHFFCGHSNCRHWGHRDANDNDKNDTKADKGAAGSDAITSSGGSDATTSSDGLQAGSAIPVATPSGGLQTGNAIPSTIPVASSVDPKLWKTYEITKTTMSLYPNPTNSYFVLNVKSVNEAKAVVRIVDATGKLMLTQNTNLVIGSNPIAFRDTNKLRSGTYIVQLIVDGQVINQKLVIAK